MVVCVSCAAPRVFPRFWDRPVQVSGAQRSAERLSSLVLSCLCLSDLVWILSGLLWRPRCTLSPGVHCLTAYLWGASYGTFGGGGGDCLAWQLAGWGRRATHRPFDLVPASWFSFRMLKWRRSSVAERDVRLRMGEPV